MNTSRTLAGALALALASSLPLAAAAATPPVDGVGVAAQIRCNTTTGGAPIYAAHADKIIFKVTGGLPALDPADQAALNAVPRNTELDIKVLDNPKSVADLKGKVLTFLGAVDNANTRVFITIDDVEYAMVCPLKPAAAAAAE